MSALNRLRGKYAVTLNLKQPGAGDVFADLLRQADIVVENFSAERSSGSASAIRSLGQSTRA